MGTSVGAAVSVGAVVSVGVAVSVGAAVSVGCALSVGAVVSVGTVVSVGAVASLTSSVDASAVPRSQVAVLLRTTQVSPVPHAGLQAETQVPATQVKPSRQAGVHDAVLEGGGSALHAASADTSARSAPRSQVDDGDRMRQAVSRAPRATKMPCGTVRNLHARRPLRIAGLATILRALLTTLRDTIRQRLSRERGTIFKDAPVRVALLYPSPYSVGMSSLGYQTIYRELNGREDTVAERAFAPDDFAEARRLRETVLSYESGRPVGDFPLVALSVAYENELGSLIETLELAGIPPLRADRAGGRHPFILMGGPLTFSNPVPLCAYADAVIIGEAEELIHRVVDVLVEHRDHDARLRALADLEHVWVPALHGETLPSVAAVDVESKLPAYAQIVTPDTELSDMFLVETERGCSRGCTYCVMRRSTNGGMRLVPMERIFARIPDDVRKVGLVGAAVSDHPRIVDIVNTLADRGLGVGLSSLRPDRLNDRFVAALKRGGYRTLTTAMDGPSERLRMSLERHAKEKHLERAAELVRAHAMQTLKLYLTVGLPSETDDDIDECVTFVTKLSQTAPVALGIAPFVSKRKTPLDLQPFAGIEVVEQRLDRLRRGLRGRADVRPTSARWAWVEWVLAQGGEKAGLAVYDAVRAGGRFADYKRAFEASGVVPTRKRKLATLGPQT